MTKALKLEIQPVLITFMMLIAALMLSACSGDKQVTYNIEEDKETGLIYNTEWQTAFNADNAYYNNTNGLLNIRTGPSDEYKVVAYLKPREGGFIKNCDYDLQWCELNFGGKPQSGWVNMAYLKEGDIEYKR